MEGASRTLSCWEELSKHPFLQSALTTTLSCRRLVEVVYLLAMFFSFFSFQHKNKSFTAAGIPAQFTVKWAQGNSLKSAALLHNHGEGQEFIHPVFPHLVSPWMGLDSSPRHFASLTHREGSLRVYLGIVEYKMRAKCLISNNIWLLLFKL